MTSLADKKESVQEMAHATARVLIASYFIAKSIGLIIDLNGMQQFLAISTVPDYLKLPNAAFELLAATSILIGFQTRLTAALLALYLFWSSFILNYAPGDPVALGAFWRDLAMIGGLLMLFSHGRGRYALDSYLERRASRKKDVHDADVVDITPKESEKADASA